MHRVRSEKSCPALLNVIGTTEGPSYADRSTEDSGFSACSTTGANGIRNPVESIF